MSNVLEAISKLKLKNSKNHFFPPQSTGSQNYNLWQRTHNFALRYLLDLAIYLTNNNFIQRMLYLDEY